MSSITFELVLDSSALIGSHLEAVQEDDQLVAGRIDQRQIFKKNVINRNSYPDKLILRCEK